jgi:hypothetical protein
MRSDILTWRAEFYWGYSLASYAEKSGKVRSLLKQVSSLKLRRYEGENEGTLNLY